MENLDISRHSPKHGFHLIHLNYFSMTCLPKNEKLSDCNYQRYTNQQLLAANAAWKRLPPYYHLLKILHILKISL